MRSSLSANEEKNERTESCTVLRRLPTACLQLGRLFESMRGAGEGADAEPHGERAVAK